MCSCCHRPNIDVLFESFAFCYFQLDPLALQLSENNMYKLFKDAGDVDWLLICQALPLTQVWINSNCLRQTLKRWYNNTGNPWSTWRKLAVVVENVYGSEAGQKLRLSAGVGEH